jgi:hypothetical protein
MAALKYQRDHRVPYVLNYLRRREILLTLFGQESEDNNRIAKEEMASIKNGRKLYLGMIQGLQDPEFMKMKEQQEKSLLGKIKTDPNLKKYVAAWDKIAEAQKRRIEIQGKALFLNNQLYGIAQTLVQMAAEDQKPNGERLSEFADSNRKSLELQLFSKAPVYKKLEQVILGDMISRAVEIHGGDNELIKKILDGKKPMDRAAEIINNTKVDNVSFRKKLSDGGQKAIEECDDPLIQLAILLDADDRKYRKIGEEISEIERQAYAQIAEALFATRGTTTYPDATFTLRLAFGIVKGYEENGKTVPAWTTIGGAYEHEKVHKGKPPWKMPASWVTNKNKLNMNTPFNFVSTADIIGGNSGSPVVNKNLELVGLIFDGNIQSLTGDYAYTDKQSRATSVHSSVIREALEKVYKADRIVQELGN